MFLAYLNHVQNLPIFLKSFRIMAIEIFSHFSFSFSLFGYVQQVKLWLRSCRVRVPLWNPNLVRGVCTARERETREGGARAGERGRSSEGGTQRGWQQGWAEEEAYQVSQQCPKSCWPSRPHPGAMGVCRGVAVHLRALSSSCGIVMMTARPELSACRTAHSTCCQIPGTSPLTVSFLWVSNPTFLRSWEEVRTAVLLLIMSFVFQYLVESMKPHSFCDANSGRAKVTKALQ